MRVETVRSSSVEQTREAGARIAGEAAAGDVYGLVGELGTGKTELVRGFVRALAPEVVVRSPSFSILNIYQTPMFPVYHFDFYRLSCATELDDIGFGDYVTGIGVCLIEWASMFPEVLPEKVTTIRFSDEGGGKRTIEICRPEPA